MSILQLLIRRLSNSKYNIPIIVATTDNLRDNEIVEIANKEGVYSFRGNESNVLSRYIGAANQFNINRIVRICADNPFIITKYIDDLVLLAERNEDKWDYLSFKSSDGIPIIKTHWGLFGELITLNCLNHIEQLGVNSTYTEHVTNYIYEHPNEFRIIWEGLPSLIASKDGFRFTVDSSQDFKLLQQIALECDLLEDLNLKEIIKVIDAHPHYIHEMKRLIRYNRK